jgi:hypothetical protein
MVKKILVGILAVLSISLAQAKEASAKGAFQGDFGLGLILGSPTGLSGEVRLARTTSIDFAVGLDAFDDEDTYFHLDYLIYLTDLSRGGSLGVPIYLGVGGNVYDHGGDFGDDMHIGARIPFGLALAFRRTPVQFFFELALNVLVVEDHDHDHDRVRLNGAIGFRVYF